jgi:hypothetical protein
MNAMTADQSTLFIAAALIATPVVLLMSGRVIRHMALCLLWLALFFSHPVVGTLAGFVILLWWPLKWFVLALFFGEGLGLGLRGSGFANRLSRRRPRFPSAHGGRPVRFARRRPWTHTELARHDKEDRRGPPRAAGKRLEDYNPWPGEDFPENLEL